MEKRFLKLIEERPLVTREYTAQDGTKKVFYSKGYVFNSGLDEFYAELTGDAARDAQPLDAEALHCMQGQIRQRSFSDKNGNRRFENTITILKLT